MALANPNIPAATVVINRWESVCNNCGKNANYHEDSHDTLMGYSVKAGEKGCGIEWTHVSSDYADLEETARKLRPDLKFINFFGSETVGSHS